MKIYSQQAFKVAHEGNTYYITQSIVPDFFVVMIIDFDGELLADLMDLETIQEFIPRFSIHHANKAK